VNAIDLLLLSISLVSYVAGQLLLKRAMGSASLRGRRWANVACFIAAIGGMTISFFVMLGLLQRFDLSYLFPFQGFSVIMITATAVIFLGERLTLRLALGALLISGGIMLVSAS
jgi:uncharacterized membrane protein